MASFKVLEVKKVDEWEGKFGPMKSYLLGVEGPDGGVEVDLNQKPDTPAPTEGQIIEGHLEDGKYRKKLKKEQPQGGGGGGGKYFKPKDPSEIRGMQRSHAQEMALRYVALMPPDCEARSIKNLSDTVFSWTDQFDADVSRATESLGEKVKNVAKSLTTEPQDRPNGSQPPSTKEVLKAAFDEYIEREGPEARTRVKLKMTALGIEDYSKMDDAQADELLGFLSGTS